MTTKTKAATGFPPARRVRAGKAVGVALLIAALIGASVPPRGAYAQARVQSPGEAVPLEILMGTLGGAAGGVLGFFGTFALCMGSGEDTTGWGSLICAILGIYGYGLGVPVGATLGVSLTGNALGVRGNVFLSALGAALGFGAGAFVLALVSEATQGNDTAILGMALVAVPFVSALGATLGYNLGARVRTPEEPAPAPAPVP